VYYFVFSSADVLDVSLVCNCAVITAREFQCKNYV
jgi:hypothetical protein